jgi:benzoate-CoA ligase
MYWSNREKSRATFLGDWVQSGDMLKVSGQYVSPVEVEMVLAQHEAVLEAAVIGVDQGGLVKTCAFVVLRHDFPPHDALADELKTFVKHHLAPHEYPRDFLFVDDLPKTATGKIQRFRLREQFQPSR